MTLAFATPLAISARNTGLVLRAFPPRSSHHRLPARVAHLRCVATSSSPPDTATGGVKTIPVGKHLTSRQIRESFLSYYENLKHRRMPSASLVPDDPTIFLTIAGMVPFKKFFMGRAQPPHLRLTSCQKCVRTNDVENVGVTKRHLTMFEMCGNFAFQDAYQKKDAIVWAWQLLTEVFEIPPQRLAVSVFEDDDEAYDIWRSVVGVPMNRIARMGAKDNFWAAGPTGPCGPCSEIYFDFNPHSDQPIDLEDDERFLEVYNLVFMQFHREQDGAEPKKLNKGNIDTGLGLERLAMVLQQADNAYETDVFMPIIDQVATELNRDYWKEPENVKTSFKVIADHARAAAHLISDEVYPSNTKKGYVVRNLIRRAMVHLRMIGVQQPFLAKLMPVVAELAEQADLKKVSSNLDKIVKAMQKEELLFISKMDEGEKILQKILSDGDVSAKQAFTLYDTFGFPFLLTQFYAANAGRAIDVQGFRVLEKQHRELSKQNHNIKGMDMKLTEEITAAREGAGPTNFVGYEQLAVSEARVTAVVGDVKQGATFYVMLDATPFYAEGGGQVGDVGTLTTKDGTTITVRDTISAGGAHVHVCTLHSDAQGEQPAIGEDDLVDATVDANRRRRTVAHHTATHLLQSALRTVMQGENIRQLGSLVDQQRLRFDFNCSRALTQDEIREIENLINSWIVQGSDALVDHMSFQDAKEKGALFLESDAYQMETVRVVDVPGVSTELCGGTHVNNTLEIGLFRVVREEKIGATTRRIEAVCGDAALGYLRDVDQVVTDVNGMLKTKREEVVDRVRAIVAENQQLAKALKETREQLAVVRVNAMANAAVPRKRGRYVVQKVDGLEPNDLQKAAATLVNTVGKDAVVVLATEHAGKAQVVAAAGKDALKQGVNCGPLVKAVAAVVGGKGGGRMDSARGGGPDVAKINDMLVFARSQLDNALDTEQ